MHNMNGDSLNESQNWILIVLLRTSKMNIIFFYVVGGIKVNWRRCREVYNWSVFCYVLRVILYFIFVMNWEKSLFRFSLKLPWLVCHRSAGVQHFASPSNCSPNKTAETIGHVDYIYLIRCQSFNRMKKTSNQFSLKVFSVKHYHRKWNNKLAPLNWTSPISSISFISELDLLRFPFSSHATLIYAFTLFHP